MNILLLASHAVAEYDDVRMFTDLGYDIFAPGGYEIPSRSGEGIRPPLPDAPHHPDLVARLQEVRAARSEPGPAIDWGKAALHDDIIDWADAIIVHHFPERWIGGQWDRIKHKRVIWRTCGQSSPELERFMGQFQGLQIVRYSPAEKRHYERIGSFAGQDALIRFGKYPADFRPWIGDWPCVINFTQHMKQRGDACGYAFWEAATRDLPPMTDGVPYRLPSGAGSEEIGGQGEVSYPMMLDNLRHARCYLYTGTRPASYTLGLIEAMLAGIPVVSIGPEAWGASWGATDLFEGRDIAQRGSDDPAVVRQTVRALLEYRDPNPPERQIAKTLFDVANVGIRWLDFLGSPSRVTMQGLTVKA